MFQPGEFHGLYSTWGHKDLDMTERLSLSFHLRGSTVDNSQDIEASYTPIHGRMSKEDVVHKEDMHKGVLLSHERNEIVPFAATRMPLVMIIQVKEVRR